MNLGSRLRDFAWWHEAVLAALLVGLLAAARLLEPGFAAPAAQVELYTHVSELALLAMPMTLIIVAGGIDLSVGSTAGLCAVVLGLSYEAGLSPWAGAGLALLTGLAAGAVNGLFVAYVRVHPLIVTLATLAAFSGIAEGISLGRPISDYPESFTFIGRGQVAGIPIPAWISLAAALAAGVTLAWTTLGRSIYAIGHNEPASRFSGLRVGRIKMLLYLLSGATAGLAAVLYVARRNTAKADVGAGLELGAITAVVLGGTSIFGGKGRVAGTVLGVLLIHEAREFVSWRWERNELIGLVIGTLLIVAVLINSMLSRRNH